MQSWRCEKHTSPAGAELELQLPRRTHATNLSLTSLLCLFPLRHLNRDIRRIFSNAGSERSAIASGVAISPAHVCGALRDPDFSSQPWGPYYQTAIMTRSPDDKSVFCADGRGGHFDLAIEFSFVTRG